MAARGRSGGDSRGAPRARTAVALGAALAVGLMPPGARAHAATRGAAPGPEAPPRAIALEVRGGREDAARLRATLQELAARGGLPVVFQRGDDPGAPHPRPPWATLSFELDGGGPSGPSSDGSAVTLREGGGRLRLRRVLPVNESRAVIVEALATIAYTALETLTREDEGEPDARPPTPPPRRAERIDDGAPGARDDRGASDTPAPVPAEHAPIPARMEVLPVTPHVAPDAGTARTEGAPVAITSRAMPSAAFAGRGSSFPVRLSLTSFAGYEAGNVIAGGRPFIGGAWGLGLGVTGSVPRWPLEPALGVALGTWHDITREGAVVDTSGGARPRGVPELQGQTELRLTVARFGRCSAALGPWLTVTRASYEGGPPPSRGPGPSPAPTPDPGAPPGGSRVSTELAGGLAARVEAEVVERVSLYLTVAGTAPLTARPAVFDGRAADPAAGGAGESQTGDTGSRLTLSAFAGLSVALTGDGRGF